MTTQQVPNRFLQNVRAPPDRSSGWHNATDQNIDRELAAKQSIALAKMAMMLDMPVVITSSMEERAQGPILPAIGEILPKAYAARVKRPSVVAMR
jgi:hypothetical protein